MGTFEYDSHEDEQGYGDENFVDDGVSVDAERKGTDEAHVEDAENGTDDSEEEGGSTKDESDGKP